MEHPNVTVLSTHAARHKPRLQPVDLVELFSHRYGDGTVYTQTARDRLLVREAMQAGLVDRDGYLTAQGRTLACQFTD